MPDLKTILVIFGVIFLMILFTRKAILQQKAAAATGTQRMKAPAAAKQQISPEAFERSWKSLGYLLLAAALGHLYVVYLSVRAAMESGSYIYWIDAGFSLTLATAALLIWRLKRQGVVIIYAGLALLPIFFFMSTGHSLEALVRLFPLVLVYLVVQPVWSAMMASPDGIESGK